MRATINEHLIRCLSSYATYCKPVLIHIMEYLDAVLPHDTKKLRWYLGAQKSGTAPSEFFAIQTLRPKSSAIQFVYSYIHIYVPVDVRLWSNDVPL